MILNAIDFSFFHCYRIFHQIHLHIHLDGFIVYVVIASNRTPYPTLVVVAGAAKIEIDE
jgi:hypothetical protein